LTSIRPADRYKSLTVKQLQDTYLSTPLGNISLDTAGGALTQAKQLLILNELREAYFQNNTLPFPQLSNVVQTAVAESKALSPLPTNEVIYQIQNISVIDTASGTCTGAITLTNGSVTSTVALISVSADGQAVIDFKGPLYITKGCYLGVIRTAGEFRVDVAYHTVSQAGE